MGGLALLVNIFERKQEARNPFYRVVEITDDTDNPAIWGKNFPLQYDHYLRTVDQVRNRFGGSEALPHSPTDADPRSVMSQSKIEEDTRLIAMWAGYDPGSRKKGLRVDDSISVPTRCTSSLDQDH